MTRTFNMQTSIRSSLTLCKVVAASALFALVTACGGGGGNPAAPPSSTTDPTKPTAAVASLIVRSDVPKLSTGGGKAILTITAVDVAGNVVAKAPVTVSVDSGFYKPNAITTGDDGQVTGTVDVGNDKSNRIITASISVPGAPTVKFALIVDGSKVEVSQSATSAGIEIIVRTFDSTGAPVPNAQVSLGGTLGASGTLQADQNGIAKTTFSTSGKPGGTYTVTASALGVTASAEAKVSFTPADLAFVVPSPALEITPNTISPNPDPDPAKQNFKAAIKVVAQNSTNQPIKDARVILKIKQPGLGVGTGERLAPASADPMVSTLIYTDSAGIARADYYSGTRTSPTDGVVIVACWGSSDAEAIACTNSKESTLTVSTQPVSIALGDDNKLAAGQGSLTYIKKFSLGINDSAGFAVSDAIVSVSTKILEYYKGPYLGPRVTCQNEDQNSNGFLDPGEDTNQDKKLTPAAANIIVSFVGGGNKTNASGFVTFQIEYPQNVATWLKYRVSASTTVLGTEGRTERDFVTNFIEGDDKNGSFLVPPFGKTANCSLPPDF